MRAGRTLEVLVKHLEIGLAADPGIEIASPNYLRDKVTGDLREFDVTVTYPGHHGLVVALECKDWSKKVGSPEVELFATKCKDVGVNGILVSATGFSEPAIKKASSNNIVCMTLEQASQFPWLRDSELKLFETELAHVTFAVETALPKLRPRSAQCLIDPSGRRVSLEFLQQFVRDLLEASRSDVEKIAVGKKSRKELTASPTGWKLEHDGYLRVPLTSIKITAHLRHRERKVPFNLFNYRKSGTACAIAQSAFGVVEIGKFKGLVSFMQLPTEQTIMIVTPAEGSVGRLSAAIIE